MSLPTVPNSLAEVVEDANAKVFGKILRLANGEPLNFRVVSVHPYSSQLNDHNTLAVVEINPNVPLEDAEDPEPIDPADLKPLITRKVRYTRIPLAQLLHYKEIEPEEGVYPMSGVSDLADFILNCDINASEEEFYIANVNEEKGTITIACTPDNLGFIGRVTISSEDVVVDVPEPEPEPEPEPGTGEGGDEDASPEDEIDAGVETNE